jgi:hypothetical protein
MEYKLIIAQDTPGKRGADWVGLRDEIERKITRILVVLNEHNSTIQRHSMTVEQYKMVFIGGLNTTFEKTEKDTIITLSQAMLIPKKISEYLEKMEDECPNASECFRF